MVLYSYEVYVIEDKQFRYGLVIAENEEDASKQIIKELWLGNEYLEQIELHNITSCHEKCVLEDWQEL